MTIPQFTAGQVLTAAELNAMVDVINVGGGLVLIKSETIGSAVSSVTVSDAFSATYDNYKIVISGGAGSASNGLNMQLGATTTGYYSGTFGFTYGGVSASAVNSNGNFFRFFGQCNTNGINASVDLIAPNLAKNTAILGQSAQNATTGTGYVISGYLDNTTAYTAFTVLTAAGTITGGTIKVYGYTN